MKKTYANTPWSELVEKIMKYDHDRYGRTDTNYKAWLETKGHLGYIFQAKMYRRCYNISKRLNDKDMFTLITGYEGVGKSTVAGLMAMLISPSFKASQYCYTEADFLEAVKAAKAGDSLILDEGAQFLFSREAMTQVNRSTLKVLALVRQRNLHIIACVPDYWAIDKKIREHRARQVFFLHESKNKTTGQKSYKFRVFTQKGIQQLNKLDRIPLMRVHMKKGYFFDATWFRWGKDFPSQNDVNWQTYEKQKHDSFSDFLDVMLKDARVREAKKKNVNIHSTSNTDTGQPATASQPVEGLLTIQQARKLMPLSEKWYRKAIQEGKIEGEKVAGKYFVSRGFLETMRQSGKMADEGRNS
jgi:energy-coupling factor transporter ATP-binding protein EcfA2